MSVSSCVTCQLYAWVSIERMKGTSSVAAARIIAFRTRSRITARALDLRGEPSPSAGTRRPERRRRRGGRRSASRSSSAGRRPRRRATTGSILGRADREDRRLRRVEDGDELLDAEHAEVRDREGAALEIACCSSPSRARPTSVGAGARDLGEREPLGRADHGHDEALRRGDGDADVRRREAQQRLVGELTFTSGWRASACAQTFDEQVGDGDADLADRARAQRSTSAFARVMSAETVSWKTGTVQAAVSRRAIVLRMFVSGIDSTSPGRRAPAAGAAGAGAPAARSTSSATMRPSGPVPVHATRARSRARGRSGARAARP